MSAYRPYPKYKPSGIEWLGDVPARWVVTKLKHAVDPGRPITYGIVQAGPDIPGGIPYVRPADMGDECGVIDPEGIMRTSPEIAASYTRSAIRTGDLVCSIGPSFGKVMIVPKWLDGGNLTQGTARVAASKFTHSKFFFWVLLSEESYGQWESSIGGATFRALNLGPLAETHTALPPLPEQHQIASFLDRECGKLDALQAKQERLIELLKEKRQALISHAVTRGLDPTAPLKPSGIEWLGDVPEHWRVQKLGHLSIIVRGASPRPAGDPQFFDGDFMPWITVAEITKDDRMYLTETATLLTEDGAKCSRVLRCGTLVLTNSGATLGVPKILAVTGCANDGVVAFESLRPDASKEFLYWYLGTLTEDLRERMKQGSGQPNLNTDIVKAIPASLPPISEQRAIVAHLDEKCGKIDQLKAKAERGIELLKERRSALISAAVTGKIDVRQS